MFSKVLKSEYTSVSGRYAWALFQVAHAHEALPQTKAALELACTLFHAQSVHRFALIRLLRAKEASPRVEQFCKISEFSPFFWRFLKILATYGRLKALKEIRHLFEALVDELLQRVSLTVFFAHPLTDNQRQKLEQNLRALFRRDLALTYTLNPSILGGVKVQGDRVTLDASVQHQIDAFIQSASTLKDLL